MRRLADTLLGIAAAMAVGAVGGGLLNCVASAFQPGRAGTAWWTVAAAEGAAGGLMWAVVAYVALLWPLSTRAILRGLPMLFGAALLGTLPAVFHSELYLFTAPACMLAGCLWLTLGSRRQASLSNDR